MHIVQLGDRVRISYARVSNSRTSTIKPHPSRTREFTVGSDEVMPGLSIGVLGMTQGDRKRLKLEPEQAFGPVDRRLVREIPRVRFPQHFVLQIGKRLRARVKSTGRRHDVRVIETSADSIVVDGNHRLAGKVITLDVTLISIDSSAHANRSKPQFDMGGEG